MYNNEDDRTTQTLEHSYRLLKLLARAYYSTHHVVVMDTLLSMGVGIGTNNKVKEVDMIAKVQLGNKQTREILSKFKADQLIHGTAVKEKEAQAEDIGKTIKGRELIKKPGLRAKVDFYWHLEPHHLVRAVKFRHTKILEKLDKQDDKQDQMYECPNPNCFEKGTEISIFQLLMDRDPLAEDDKFRCKHCHLEKNGKKMFIPLKLTKSSAGKAGTSKDLKAKFNKQITVVTAELGILDNLLKEAKKVAAEEAEANNEQKDESMSGGSDRKEEEAKLKAEGLQQQKFLEGALNRDGKINFSIGNTEHVADDEPPSKKAKVASTAAPLPWDMRAREELEAERRKVELARQHELDRQKEAQVASDNQTYSDKKAAMLEKLQRTQENAEAAPALEQQAVEEDESDPTVSITIAGAPLTCKLSEISEDQVGEMTEAEFDHYNDLTAQHAQDADDDFDGL